jgi:hypothetical protein
MSIEEKDGRSLAAAESLVPNENQNHCYSKDETPDHVQGKFEHKGESAERDQKVGSKATLGRHITSGKDGTAVRKEREAHVLANRKETEKLFDRKSR